LNLYIFWRKEEGGRRKEEEGRRDKNDNGG
jgi:hypothetical protein